MTDQEFQKYLEAHTKETQQVFQKKRVKKIIPRINLVVTNEFDKEYDTFPIHIDHGFPTEKKKQCWMLYKIGYEFFRFGFVPEAAFLVSSVFLKAEKKKALIIAGLTNNGTARIAIAPLKKSEKRIQIDDFIICKKRNLLLTFFFLGWKSAKLDVSAEFN